MEKRMDGFDSHNLDHRILKIMARQDIPTHKFNIRDKIYPYSRDIGLWEVR